MPFIRSIGRWTLTALVVNAVIGAGIFGLPSELSRLLGRASPLAMVAAGFMMSIMLLCMAEVASQFSEPGGPYLYVHRAFGRFAGLQVAWFHLLAGIGGGAASAALFVSYMGGIVPSASQGWPRALLLLVLVMIPTIANYFGVRSGSNLASMLTISKLLPLALVIALGLLRVKEHFQPLHLSEITSPGSASWLSALLALTFAYGGSEDALVPAGEMKEPRRNVPFALLLGLLVCAVVYTLVQFVTVVIIGVSSSDRPLAQTASVLIGQPGEMVVIAAVMISTYGWLSGAILNLPRLAASLALQGDFPDFLGRLHPKFNTPATAILLYGAVTWLLAAAGTFLWAAVVSGAATALIYAGTCATLIRLRHQMPSADALRVPLGTVLAVMGIVIALALLTQLQLHEAWLVVLTASIAAVNWWLAKWREDRKQITV